jgi:hypothetical protein
MATMEAKMDALKTAHDQIQCIKRESRIKWENILPSMLSSLSVALVLYLIAKLASGGDMAETFLNIMNDVEALRPSSTEFSFATRSRWMWQIAKKIYFDLGILKSQDYLLSTTVNFYDLTTGSTQIRIDNVKKIYVTTTETTAINKTTQSQDWTEWKLDDILDPINPNTIRFDNYWGEKHVMRVFYTPIPALFPTTSTDSSTLTDLDDECVSPLKWGTLSMICKAGDAPDVQMANAYEADYREEMRRLKANMRTRTRRMATGKVDYKEMW